MMRRRLCLLCGLEKVVLGNVTFKLRSEGPAGICKALGVGSREIQAEGVANTNLRGGKEHGILGIGKCPVWPQCVAQGRRWRTRGEAGGQLGLTSGFSRARFQTLVNIPRATGSLH